ncbi:Cupredoxin [Mycena filopes]|nr:Cupredoxin [Mycena filopes]
MLFNLALAALVSSAAAVTQNVKVGANGTLAFDPPSITAAQGDVIVFQFLAKNHSVTQSTFATPCAIMTTPMAGIDSGFQFVDANATQIPQYSFTVNNATSPLWFYCAQTNPVSHCSKGMVFAVNPPATGKTFSAFQAAAMGGSNATASGSAAGASGTPAPSGALMTRASVVGALVAAAAGAITLL